MTTTSIRTATPPSSEPTGAIGAPHGPSRRHRRILIGAVGTLVAIAAASTGVLLGQRATSPTVPTVGTPVTFPSDWQVYRAGERGDVVAAPQPAPSVGTAVTFPSDWQVYRAGERATGTTAPSVGTAVTFPSDWLTYRAGEH